MSWSNCLSQTETEEFLHPKRYIIIMLFCLVLGEVPAREFNFVVDITKEMVYVSHLQKAIRDAKEQEPPFDVISFNRLKLWKVDIPTDDGNNKLKTLDAVLSHRIDIKKQLGGEEMFPSMKIKNYFPQDLTDNHIHIIVQPVTAEKRRHGDSDSDEEIRTRKKERKTPITLASLLPSSTIQSSVIKTLSHEFYDRDQALNAMLEVARLNYSNRKSSDHKDHRFILIPGGIGIGKTRTGWESQHLFSNLKDEVDVFFKEALRDPLYISVDLNNGYKFLRGFDEHASSTVRIGARVALASGLMSGSLYDLWQGGNINRFHLYDVVREILKHRSKKVGAIIIHLDEYQLYIDAIQEFQNKEWKEARSLFKEMLKEIGSIMRDNLKITDEIRKETNDEVDFFMIPICTGTSAIDIQTEYTNRVLELKPLDYNAAKSMFLDRYDYSKQTDKTHKEYIEQSLKSHYSSDYNDKDIINLSTKFCNDVLERQHFRIAIFDTGFIPKFIDDLLGPPHLTLDFDWGNQLFSKMSKRTIAKVEDSPGNWRSLKDIRTIISFGLTRQHIRRDFLLPSGISIGELERAGLIYLSHSKGEQYTIVMPFIQLKILNNILLTSDVETVIPDHLLLIPTYDVPWQWQNFENLYGYYQKVIIDSLIEVKNSMILSIKHKIRQLKIEDGKQTDSYEINKIHIKINRETDDLAIQTGKNWQLSDIFRGAKGANALLQRKVQLRKLKVFIEKEKFLQLTDEIAKFDKSVLCGDNVTRPLNEGVFRCYQGCANIDHRWALDSADSGKNLAIFSQIKYSETDSSTTMSTPAIKRWYNTTMASVKNYESEYDVVLVLFTNRTCTGNIDIEQMPKLILIYPDNIEMYLSPAFAHRGLIDRPSENNY